jgi:hypothetical protein
VDFYYFTLKEIFICLLESTLKPIKKLVSISKSSCAADDYPYEDNNPPFSDPSPKSKSVYHYSYLNKVQPQKSIEQELSAQRQLEFEYLSREKINERKLYIMDLERQSVMNRNEEEELKRKLRIQDMESRHELEQAERSAKLKAIFAKTQVTTDSLEFDARLDNRRK